MMRLTDTFLLKMPHKNIGPVLGFRQCVKMGRVATFVQKLGFEHKAKVTLTIKTLKTPQIGTKLTFQSLPVT